MIFQVSDLSSLKPQFINTFIGIIGGVRWQMVCVWRVEKRETEKETGGGVGGMWLSLSMGPITATRERDHLQPGNHYARVTGYPTSKPWVTSPQMECKDPISSHGQTEPPAVWLDMMYCWSLECPYCFYYSPTTESWTNTHRIPTWL